MRWLPAILIAICLKLAAAGTALAGDFAIVESLGFSRDGRYFAFRESGTRDASVHPYATVHIVDLDSGRPAPGSPFVVEIGNEEASEDMARAQALAKAQATLAGLDIGARPTISVTDPRGELAEGVTPDRAYEAMRAQASRLEIEGVLPTGRLAVEIESSVLADAACAALGRDDVHGFALARVSPTGARSTVHSDRANGSERNCPARYGLAALHFYKAANAAPRLVALVAYYPRTWEEPDRRYLAIPVPLPD